ncbi:MAG: UDP-N-acetylmuramate dehydrogenase [Fibromonadales bacterium]|nr:UDP-N-acetylmuramate dehydrogenase [Fibromonadales bacterium]
MISQNVSLKKYSTFKIGGPAKLFAEPKSIAEIRELLMFCKKNKEKFFILGNGSNILFNDNGYDGLVIKIGKKLESGKSLHDVIHAAADKGLGGMEKLEGIPGTLGGAIFMNAGAHGQQISDCIKSVVSVTNYGGIVTRTNEECKFSYRSSTFKMLDEIIVSAEFDFTPMPKEIINKNRKEVLAWRREKQPLKYPNAGSIFKNPTSNLPLTDSHLSAGYLIDSCGLKGCRVGDAQVSELHANFIVNRGSATASDVKALMEKIVQEVKKKHGIVLEPEICIF